MLRDIVSLSSAVLSFETVLKIEYEEAETERVIQSSLNKLENAYGMRIHGKKLYELQAENVNLADNIQNLLMQILECTKTVSFIFQVGMYQHAIPISLSTVKYLGLGKEALQSILRYFQNVDVRYLAENAIGQIILGLDGIDMNIVKRLFVIMLVLNRLGVDEAVAIVAQLLYYGSVWEDKTDASLR